MKPRFGLDLDGVIYSWSGTVRFLMKHHFGYQLEEATEWDAYKRQVRKEDWNWLWDKAKENGLFRHGSLYTGAMEFVTALAKVTDVVVMTKRPEHAAVDTLRWLAHHEVPTREIHILGEKGKKSEIKHCKFYLDDSPTNIEDFTTNVPEATSFLMDRAWNQDCKVGKRMKSFEEILRAVRFMEVYDANRIAWASPGTNRDLSALNGAEER